MPKDTKTETQIQRVFTLLLHDPELALTTIKIKGVNYESHDLGMGVPTEFTWDTLVKFLLTPVNPETKWMSGWWSPATYKRLKRRQGSVVEVHVIVVDVDVNAPMLDVMLKRLRGRGWNAVLIPSYSSTADKPKWRIVIEIDRPISGTSDEITKVQKKVIRSVSRLLGVTPDPNCQKDSARLYYNSTKPGHQIVGEPLNLDEMVKLADLGHIDVGKTLVNAGIIEEEEPENSVDLVCPSHMCHSETSPRKGQAFYGSKYKTIICNHTTCTRDVNEEEPDLTRTGITSTGHVYQLIRDGIIKPEHVVQVWRKPRVKVQKDYYDTLVEQESGKLRGQLYLRQLTPFIRTPVNQLGSVTLNENGDEIVIRDGVAFPARSDKLVEASPARVSRILNKTTQYYTARERDDDQKFLNTASPVEQYASNVADSILDDLFAFNNTTPIISEGKGTPNALVKLTWNI